MRFRSPYGLSMRDTGGQNLWWRRPATGNAACSREYRVRPDIRRHILSRVRGLFQHVVDRVGGAGGDGLDFGVDRDHRVAEAVEFDERFALGRLDHQRARHGKRDGGRVESIVHQALGHVLLVDAGGLFEGPKVEDRARARCGRGSPAYSTGK